MSMLLLPLLAALFGACRGWAVAASAAGAAPAALPGWHLAEGNRKVQDIRSSSHYKPPTHPATETHGSGACPSSRYSQQVPATGQPQTRPG